MKIATGLTEEGRRALLHFLADNLGDKTLTHLVAPWVDDITFDISEGTEGHLELSRLATKSGNPVVKIFSGDEVELEYVEEEE